MIVHRVNNCLMTNGECIIARLFNLTTSLVKMSTDLAIFRVVLYYSIAILALPISTFFTTKVILFDRIFGTDNVTGNVYSAICAILMLHGALALFIYKAYSDGGDVKVKSDKTE